MSMASKQFSNKLVTRKFTINPGSIKRSSMMGSDEDFTAAMKSGMQMDMGGGMDMLESAGFNQSGLSE